MILDDICQEFLYIKKYTFKGSVFLRTDIDEGKLIHLQPRYDRMTTYKSVIYIPFKYKGYTIELNKIIF